MAKAKKGTSAVSVRDMTKESIVVKSDLGEIIVPTTRHEAAFLNMLTAAQLRTTLQNAMKDWKDKGMSPTPKELADLARAAAEIGKLSMESVPVDEGSPERRAEPPETQGKDGSADFSGLLKEKPEGAIDIDANEPRNPPKADGEPVDPGIPGEEHPGTT